MNASNDTPFPCPLCHHSTPLGAVEAARILTVDCPKCHWRELGQPRVEMALKIKRLEAESAARGPAMAQLLINYTEALLKIDSMQAAIRVLN